ncbi:putative cytochrome P450 313a3 [Arctopsyche grandis]|uniref:putative cytochrome P450 313a3 n=1 Tax=Arctopsyche grandis TaxID=121162 RepID=UPI00406D8122
MDDTFDMDINQVAYIGIGLYCLKSTLSWLWCRRKLYSLSGKVGGPFSLPIIGTVKPFQLTNFLNGTTKNFQDLIQKYKGFFSIWIGPRLFVVTSESSDIEELMESDCVTGGPPFLMDILGRAIGRGIHTKSYSKNDYPEALENALNPFAGKDFKKCYQIILQRNSKLLVERMNALCNEKLENVSTTIDRCMADIITESLFGIESHFHEGDQDGVIELHKIISKTIFKRISKFWLEYEYVYIHTDLGAHQTLATSDLKAFITKSIEKRINTLNGDYSHETTFMVDALLKYHINGNYAAKNILQETMSSWNIGMTLTCDTMNLFILMLAMHKKCQDKAFAEIHKFYATNKDSPVERDHLENFRYLRSCLDETLRLYPIFPLLPKYTTRDFTLINRNLAIPAGTTIILANYVNKRSSELWEKPEKFIPERFDTEKYAKRQPASFVNQYSECEDFEKMMMLTGAVYLLRNYEFNSDWKDLSATLMAQNTSATRRK